MTDLGLPDEVLRAAVHAAPPALGSALAGVLRTYAARFGKPRWGDKRPGYYRDVTALLRLLPDAQLVHVRRDARACVASLKRMPWYRQDVLAALATWVEAQDAADHWRSRLGPGAWHDLVYEDLVRDPEPVLRRLCAFLGEEYDPAVTRPQDAAAVAVPGRKTWHARTSSGISAERLTAYRGGLTREELALVERVAGRRLVALGHVLDAPGRVPPGLLARYARTAVHRRLAQRKQRAADRWRDARIGLPLAAVPAPDRVLDLTALEPPAPAPEQPPVPAPERAQRR